LIAGHAADVDPFVLQRSQHKIVPADSPDEPHSGTESRRRDGLIRALTPRKAREYRVGHRLATPRQPLTTSNQIDVRRSDDRDLRRWRHTRSC
jgi:hypothetical protein